MGKEAKWTVMIYASGNNDLEPEVWQAMLAAEKVCLGEDVKVVMQIVRAEGTLVAIFRPQHVSKCVCDSWTGVRRYLLTAGKPNILADLGMKNMADPLCLYEFVKESMACFPAERYMVIVGGHGYQFVGSMPDYSQDTPYIMGYPGMARALDMACTECASRIDLLIADVCYFNFVEMIYEFGGHTSHAVRYVLTYICDGPIAGMAYDELLRCLQCNADLHIRELVARIMAEMKLDLVAVELDHEKLNHVKESFHQLAVLYLQHKDSTPAKLCDVLFVNEPHCPWFEASRTALQGLEDLIIGYQRVTDNDYGLLNIANVPTGIVKADSLYTRLRFAQDNDWTYALTGRRSFPPSEDWPNEDLVPIPLAPHEVYAYISLMNEGLSNEQKRAILDRVADYKHWFGR